MGKVVTVMNMKGGVGKTTVAMHVGGALGRYVWQGKNPRKVLLIDYDPQFNLSQAFLPTKQYFALDAARKTIIAVLQEDGTKLDPYTLQLPTTSSPPPLGELAVTISGSKAGSQLDLIPSTLDLMYVALGRSDGQTNIIEERFRSFIAQCRPKYDLVMIDCHPAGSLMTKTALTNSDDVLIPVAPERYAARGIGLMLEFINAKKQGGNGPTPHIIFNRVPRTGHTALELAIRADKKYAKYCLTNTLKKYTAFSDPEDGNHFVWVSSKPYSTEAKRNMQIVADEFANRIGI